MIFCMVRAEHSHSPKKESCSALVVPIEINAIGNVTTFLEHE